MHLQLFFLAHSKVSSTFKLLENLLFLKSFLQVIHENSLWEISREDSTIFTTKNSIHLTLRDSPSEVSTYCTLCTVHRVLLFSREKGKSYSCFWQHCKKEKTVLFTHAISLEFSQAFFTLYCC